MMRHFLSLIESSTIFSQRTSILQKHFVHWTTTRCVTTTPGSKIFGKTFLSFVDTVGNDPQNGHGFNSVNHIILSSFRAEFAYECYLSHQIILNPFWFCYRDVHLRTAPRAVAICLVLVLPGSVLAVGTGHVHVAFLPFCLARFCIYPCRMNQAHPFCLREAAELYLLTHFSRSPHSPT